MGSNMSLVPPKKKQKLKKWLNRRKTERVLAFCDKCFLKNPNKEFNKTIRESCPK